MSDPATLSDVPRSTGDEHLNRLAAALRRISATAVGQPLADEAVAAAAEQMGRLADSLAMVAGSARRPRGVPDRSGRPQDYFPTSPMIGYGNPIAPPADVWAGVGEDGRPEIRGRVTFDYPYEGPPTCVHGGVMAELFDELLGSACILAETPGMTGTLTVRYRRPTPLLVPLDLVARLTGVEGRKIFAWGGIYHDGELTAEADGIFIEVKPAGMLDIAVANARSTSSPVLDLEFARLTAERGVD